jgi:hypothetical protein
MSFTREVPFDSLSDLRARLPAAGTVDATIEIVGEDIGDQIEAQKLPWHALVYDEPNDVLEISVGGVDPAVPVVLRHEIHSPEGLWVEETEGSVRAISIKCEDGPQTIVRFHERHALGTGSR